MNATDSLAFDALQIVLQHGSDLLNARELGRVSILSKSTQKIVEDSNAWKRLWERAVALGQDFSGALVPSGLPLHTRDRYNVRAWNGEPGLLPFFLDPEPRVLDRVGYKHACGCLLSKHCFHCGNMAATANPLTLTRICKTCYQNDEDSFAIAKAKAKESFLVSEKDLRSLVSISHDVPLVTGQGTTGTSVLYLLSDVKDASFAKYGGADGLAQEFTARTEKAMAKYNKSQTTAKPQKKRPKITKMAHRPAESPSVLRSWWLPIQIGCVFTDPETSETKMMNPCDCHMCGVKGRPLDIMRHERFDHGYYFPLGFLEQESGTATRTAPANLTPLANLDLPNELIRLLASAERTYVRDSSAASLGIPGLEFYPAVQIYQLFDLQFPGLPCKIAVDLFFRGDQSLVAGLGSYVVSCQLAPNTCPTELLWLGILQSSSSESFEADEAAFRMVTNALGLRETSPAQLLAAVMACAICFQGSFLQETFRSSDENDSRIPIMREAYKVWSTGSDDDDDDDDAVSSSDY